jgi:DUF438 domain-containing protein
MNEDTIVREIRKIREAHAARFNYELSAIFADLKKKEEHCGHPVVSFKPRRRAKRTGI